MDIFIVKIPFILFGIPNAEQSCLSTGMRVAIVFCLAVETRQLRSRLGVQRRIWPQTLPVELLKFGNRCYLSCILV